MLFVVLVLASGTAVAASQVFGPPVRSGLVLTGGPKPGQVLLVQLRVSDPVGGFPWGVRIYTPRSNTRSAGGALSCLQIGRVLDGRLGVIGEDGAFADDGLFHVLPVAPLTGCTPAAANSLYLAYVPTSAFTGSGACAATPVGGQPTAATAWRVARSSRACPTGDLRLVVYGVATRGASSVRLAGPSGVQSERLVAADRGAFIFVLSAADLNASRAQIRVTFGY